MSSPTATLISRLGASWGQSGRDRQGAPAAMAASGQQEQARGPAVGQGAAWPRGPARATGLVAQPLAGSSQRG